jgi:hypothetical protein
MPRSLTAIVSSNSFSLRFEDFNEPTTPPDIPSGRVNVKHLFASEIPFDFRLVSDEQIAINPKRGAGGNLKGGEVNASVDRVNHRNHSTIGAAPPRANSVATGEVWSFRGAELQHGSERSCFRMTVQIYSGWFARENLRDGIIFETRKIRLLGVRASCQRNERQNYWDDWDAHVSESIQRHNA